MQNIKIGYLPLYIKLYDDFNEMDRAPLEAYMHELADMLREHGLTVVEAPVCRIRSEFEAAVARFHKEDVAAIVTQHLAYSPSLESIDALQNAGVPIIVLDTTPDYALIDEAKTYNGIDHNHGIHGVQDMCSMLRRRGVPFSLCAGHALYSDVIERVAGHCRAAAVAKAYRGARVGRAGGSFDGMGDFTIADEAYRAAIGAEVFDLQASDAREALQSVTDVEIDAEMQEDEARFAREIEDAASYCESVRAGLALRKWAKKLRLTAYTLNFAQIDESGLTKMPFAECCKAMAAGLGYAGEGDVLTAGLVGALRSVYEETTFTEIFCPDWKQNVLLLSHMGEANLALAKDKPLLRTMPFRYNASGDTAAPAMCFKPGQAVLVNLAPTKEGFSLIASQVEMLDCDVEDGAYRNGIRGWMKPLLPVADFLEAYSNLGGTHHSALVYGADPDEILAFGKMMGFETHEI